MRIPLRWVVRVSFCSCMPALDMSGGLGIDQRLQDRVEQGAHQLVVIGGAHRFSQFEQDKLRGIA